MSCSAPGTIEDHPWRHHPSRLGGTIRDSPLCHWAWKHPRLGLQSDGRQTHHQQGQSIGLHRSSADMATLSLWQVRSLPRWTCDAMMYWYSHPDENRVCCAGSSPGKDWVCRVRAQTKTETFVLPVLRPRRVEAIEFGCFVQKLRISVWRICLFSLLQWPLRTCARLFSEGSASSSLQRSSCGQGSV